MVLPLGQALQVVLGLRTVPPELKVPWVQAEQVAPPVPAEQMAMLQVEAALWPTDLVVKPAPQAVQLGLGVFLSPPADQVPMGQGVQLLLPRPAEQMVTEQALEVVAPVVDVVLPAGQEVQVGVGWVRLPPAE